MTENYGSSDDTSTMIPPTPPTAPASNFAATGPLSYGTAPTPPPLAPEHRPDARRRRPVRTVIGVVIAVLAIGLKLAVAFGATHLLRGGSGPVVFIVVAAVILLGFVSRFFRI